MLKFVKKEKLVIPLFENVNQSKVDYTYFVNNYNACLDHIFVFNTNEFINSNLSKIKSMINEDTINTSDHHSVSIEIFFKELMNCQSIKQIIAILPYFLKISTIIHTNNLLL